MRIPRVAGRLFRGTIVSATLALSVFVHADPVSEVGTLVQSQASSTEWHNVTFNETYTAPPVVVFGPPSSNDLDPFTIRVRNVTTTGFEWQIDEYEYLDGVHGVETVTYIAVEEGVHNVSGLVFEAGRVTSGNGFTTHTLSGTHTVAPVILLQAESDANSVTTDDTICVNTRVRNISTTTFQTQLQDQELNTASLVSESVGYIAITPGQGVLDGRPFEVFASDKIIEEFYNTLTYGGLLKNPAVLGNMQTRAGGDPCELRIDNVTDSSLDMWLEEEQSANNEVGHVTEVAGLMIFGDLYGEAESKLDIFTISLNQNVQTIALSGNYTNPVVVAGPASSVGTAALSVSVSNVTSSSFDIELDEWDYLDGSHSTEEVTVMVMESGIFRMGGLVWQAGEIAAVTEAATSESFYDTFQDTPVVFGQVVTRNETEAVTERFTSIDKSGFSVKLDEEKANDGVHAAETVHYIAIEKGQGVFTSVGGLNFAVSDTGDTVTNSNYSLSFGVNYAAPLFVGDIQSYNEPDTATLRKRTLSAGEASIYVHEENSTGDGTGHAAESIGYLVAASVIDSDGDGLGDQWEIDNGLNPNDPSDAGLDPDGDLLTNLEEYELSYNPNAFNGGRVDALDRDKDAYEAEGTRGRVRIRRRDGIAPVAVNFTVDGGNDADTASDASDYVVTLADGTVLNGSVVIPENSSGVDIYIDPVDDGIYEYPENWRVSVLSDSNYNKVGSNRSGTISDATNDPANNKLYVGLYQAEPWAIGQTSGSGVATLIVNGTNTQATVASSFGGLSTPQTVAHIHHADAAAPSSAAGPIVIGVPNGQFENEVWDIVPTGSYTGQDLIDSLNKQNGLFIYINVHTTQFTAGEIRAVFGLADGGPFDPPTDPPAVTPLTGDDLTRDVARFLTQSTFGPTEAEITALVDDINNNHGGDRIAGFSQWIDDQFALDQTNLRDYTYYADAQEWNLRGGDPVNFAGNNEVDHNNRRRGWWTIAVGAHDQLRQRAGFALSQIFIISEAASLVRTRHYGAATYYDNLVTHADGNFRTLIEDVSKSPMMGYYLSHLKNQKAILDPVTGDVVVAPDENYAREIMQLFSIGLLALNPDGTLSLNNEGLPIQTYTNEDITELARVFTGWSFAVTSGAKADGYPEVVNNNFNRGNGAKYFQYQWETPMKSFADFHDTGEKNFLGGTVPAGLDGEADLDAALDIILNHPNLGPFLSRLMIQRLTHSNPSRGYIYRVAQAFENGTYNGSGSGQRGDFGAMVKAILLDYEARSLDLADDISYGKQKEPIIRYTQILRSLNASSQLPLSDLNAFGYPATQFDNFPVTQTRFRYGETTGQLSQSPLDAPSVFNWFLPDYEPGGAISAAGLYAPEMIQTTETQTISVINYMRTVAYGNNGQGGNALIGQTDSLLDNIKVDRAALQAIYDAEIAGGATVAEATETLVDHLDVLLMSGNFKATYELAATPNPRSTVIDTLVSMSNGNRVREAMYLMIITPEYMHQK